MQYGYDSNHRFQTMLGQIRFRNVRLNYDRLSYVIRLQNFGDFEYVSALMCGIMLGASGLMLFYFCTSIAALAVAFGAIMGM